MPANLSDIEKRLWDAADELRANSRLKASQYSIPVLGLIFLRFADHRFMRAMREAGAGAVKELDRTACRARGVLYLPPEARFSHLLRLPVGTDAGLAVNVAMRAIEAENEELAGVLPQRYERLESATLVALLRLLSSIPLDVEGDTFGRIYEYFLGKFAMSEGQKGGEFFTPTAVVQLIVEIIEPFHGRILDPACGSGGMFVQSARFVASHRRNPLAEISIFGLERVAETVQLCKMNQAVHGLSGEIRQGNAYYENPYDALGRFDFVMANPPFNVGRVDRSRLEDDPRFPFGMPRIDNANYLWIQIFYSALNESGRAGFVMANSASDARGSERDLRQRLILTGAVDVVLAVASNFFYTVTLPCTLWFLDKAKAASERRDTVLFIDARHVFRQLSRAHRDFSPVQIEMLANLVRLYRGEATENLNGSQELLDRHLEGREGLTIPGLCRVATVAEIEAEGWSLNPGRYVGVPDWVGSEDFDFVERLVELQDELRTLSLQAKHLESAIERNVGTLLALH